MAVQHPDRLRNKERRVSFLLYSSAFSFVPDRNFCVCKSHSLRDLASNWDTLIANLELNLKKEKRHRPDSETPVYILTVVLPSKMDHFLNCRSRLLTNAEPSNRDEGRMKLHGPFLDVDWAKNKIHACLHIKGGANCPCLGYLELMGHQQNTGPSPVLHQLNKEQKFLFRSIENVRDYPWLLSCLVEWFSENVTNNTTLWEPNNRLSNCKFCRRRWTKDWLIGL